MSPSFHFDLGPFSFAVSTGPDGIAYERGNTKLYFDWRRIAGAVLVREQPSQAKDDQDLAAARGFFGKSFDLETIKTLRDSMATIYIAYRDDRERLRHERFPIPLTDAGFLQDMKRAGREIDRSDRKLPLCSTSPVIQPSGVSLHRSVNLVIRKSFGRT